eukprot:UN24721
MIDKITFPFQTPRGLWVRTGLIERTIEGVYFIFIKQFSLDGLRYFEDQTFIQNAAVFSSKEASWDEVVLVVFLANSHIDNSPTHVLNYVQSILAKLTEHTAWEIRTKISSRLYSITCVLCTFKIPSKFCLCVPSII